MAPSKPGGRPKNAWNSSRRRKLVRLYTLTLLSTAEITQVLKADGFNPCLRDIQARLKDLFPSDYAKKFHQYRPANGTPYAIRLKRLQQHRQASKSRAMQFSKDKKASLSTSAEHTYAWLDQSHIFEGPLSAFRNYTGSHSASDKLPQLSLSSHSTESQLVNPSLLLLDGSSVAGTEGSSIDKHLNNPVQPLSDQVLSTPSLGQSQALVRQSSRSSVVSLASLQARLSRRSSSMVRHIHSVLRYSSSDSWRSSISWRSSWISFGSQASATSMLSSPGGLTTSDEESYNMHCLDASNQFKSISLEESQNNVSKVLENNKSPPYYYGDGHKEYLMAYERCLCGKPGPHIVNGQCADCGMQPIHSYIRYLRGPDIPRKIPSEQINQRDYFDNGPLHFAAKFKSKTPELLFRMIDMGADIHSVNTSGATFLHVLFRFMQPHQILHFLPLLRRLADLGFSFLIRDYWGRQPVHLLLKGAHSPSLDSVDRLEEVFSILKPDIDALDIDGRSARSLISNRFGQGKMKTRVSEFLSQFPWSKNSTLEFRVVLSIMDTDWSAWIKWVSLEGRSTWIDSHGDTALIALLKHWDYAQDEFLIDNRIVEMVGFGSEINMRDRHGDTALAIATQRGLRPAVESLIRLQASIHTTNFKGRGILRSAQKQMALAKQNGQDKLYAMIWSCIICLVDLKACKCPSLRRELWARWAPDSHFQWDARESEVKVEKIVRVLSESGFI